MKRQSLRTLAYLIAVRISASRAPGNTELVEISNLERVRDGELAATRRYHIASRAAVAVHATTRPVRRYLGAIGFFDDSFHAAASVGYRWQHLEHAASVFAHGAVGNFAPFAGTVAAATVARTLAPLFNNRAAQRYRAATVVSEQIKALEANAPSA